jgi:hypothetical protein
VHGLILGWFRANVESGQPEVNMLLHEIVEPVKSDEEDQSAGASGA